MFIEDGFRPSHNLGCYLTLYRRNGGLRESRRTLIDLHELMNIDLRTDKFTQREKSLFRLWLLMYCHIVETDAPYEVITNLLRFRRARRLGTAETMRTPDARD